MNSIADGEHSLIEISTNIYEYSNLFQNTELFIQRIDSQKFYLLFRLSASAILVAVLKIKSIRLYLLLFKPKALDRFLCSFYMKQYRH